MRIDERKFKMALAEKQMSASLLAERCSISRTRLYSLLRSNSILPKTAGKVAKGLGVSVSEIIDDRW